MDVHENRENIAVLGEQYRNLSRDFTDLSKSYRVLNDHHGVLERKFTVMETEWHTAKNLLSWVAGGSLLTLVVSLVNLLKMLNVI